MSVLPGQIIFWGEGNKNAARNWSCMGYCSCIIGRGDARARVLHHNYLLVFGSPREWKQVSPQMG